MDRGAVPAAGGDSERLGRLKAAFSRLRQRFLGHSFLANVMVLAGGTVMGQGLSMLAAPALTRLYSPADFGTLAIYSSVVSILVVPASLRYELAIPVADDDETAADLLALSLLSVFGMSLLVGLGVWALRGSIIRWTGAGALAPHLWLLPAGLLGAGAYQALTYWAIRKKAFPCLAHTRLSQGVGMVLVQASLGLLRLGPFGLIVGDAVGRISGVGTLIKQLGFHRFRPDGIRRAAAAHVRFPLVMLWAAVLNALTLQAPLVLLPAYFGLGPTGKYFLAYRVLTLPTSMLAAAVSQVFLAEIAQSPSRSHTQNLTRGVTTLMLAIGVPIYMGILLLGPSAFSLFFGSGWREAGEYARLLAPMLLIRLVGTTLSALLTVGKRFEEAVMFTLLELVGSLFAIGLGVHYHSMHLFVLASSGIAVPLCLLSVWRFARVAEISAIRLLARSLTTILPIGFTTLVILVLGMIYLPGPMPVLLWLLSIVPAILLSLKRPELRGLLRSSHGAVS